MYLANNHVHTTRTDLIQKNDVMISIDLKNGSFECNEELIPEINKAISELGILNLGELKIITEEQFFAVFTPFLNER